MVEYDFEKELEELKSLISVLKEETSFLRKQHAELKAFAEKAGTEMAMWKHKCIRLEEENKQLNMKLNIKNIK